MEDPACQQAGSEPDADPGSDPEAGTGGAGADDPEERSRGGGDHGKKSPRMCWKCGRHWKNWRFSLCCDKITEEEIEELKGSSQRISESVFKDGDDITKIAEADVRFHDVIYMATDNQKLIQLLNNLREQMYRYRVEYLKRPGSPSEAACRA